MPSKGLGEILREADLVSEAQLTEALALQRTFGERLASILVRQKILTEKFAVTYLGRQLGVPPVDLSKTEIDLSLLEVVPLELCERHLVFPVRVEGTRLQLAMSDPMDHVLVSEIEFKTGVRWLDDRPRVEHQERHPRGAVRPEGGPEDITPNVQRAARRRRPRRRRPRRPPPAPPPRSRPWRSARKRSSRPWRARRSRPSRPPCRRGFRRSRRRRPSWPWTTTR